jgi:hypothetical protein
MKVRQQAAEDQRTFSLALVAKLCIYQSLFLEAVG